MAPMVRARGYTVSGFKRVLPRQLFEEPFWDDTERDVAIVELAAKALAKLIRYERGAANRRDRALRELERLKADLLI